jgi:hypothetical protein
MEDITAMIIFPHVNWCKDNFEVFEEWIDDPYVKARVGRPQMFVPYYHQLPPPPSLFTLMPQIVT